jgi:hypothetical protein
MSNSQAVQRPVVDGSLEHELVRALEDCVVILAGMDTLRHLEPNFPALDGARRVLAKVKEQS